MATDTTHWLLNAARQQNVQLIPSPSPPKKKKKREAILIVDPDVGIRQLSWHGRIESH